MDWVIRCKNIFCIPCYIYRCVINRGTFLRGSRARYNKQISFRKQVSQSIRSAKVTECFTSIGVWNFGHNLNNNEKF